MTIASSFSPLLRLCSFDVRGVYTRVERSLAEADSNTRAATGTGVPARARRCESRSRLHTQPHAHTHTRTHARTVAAIAATQPPPQAAHHTNKPVPANNSRHHVLRTHTAAHPKCGWGHN